MGRKEFYEKLEELNWIREKLIKLEKQKMADPNYRNLLGEINDELAHLKLLQ